MHAIIKKSQIGQAQIEFLGMHFKKEDTSLVLTLPKNC